MRKLPIAALLAASLVAGTLSVSATVASAAPRGRTSVNFSSGSATCFTHFNKTSSGLVHEWRTGDPSCPPISDQFGNQVYQLHFVFRPTSAAKASPLCDPEHLIASFPYTHSAAAYTELVGDEANLADYLDNGRQYNVCVYPLSVPTVTIANNPTVDEGENLVYNISLSAPSETQVTVTVRTSEAFSIATAGEDYTAKTETVVFAPGETVKPFVVQTTDDSVDDLDSGFNGEFVWAEIVGATNADLPDPDFTTNSATDDAWGLGVLLDDEVAPVVTVSDATAVEGSPLSYSLTLSHPSDNVVTATIETSQAFSAAGQYTPNSATVTFPRHDTAESFVVQTIDDAIDESDATSLNAHAIVWTYITAAQNATLPVDFSGNSSQADRWGLGLITDNDPTASA